jgi:hypothetical protein
MDVRRTWEVRRTSRKEEHVSDFSGWQQWLPIFLPLLIIELVLLALALWDWVHRQRFRYLNRWVWLAIIVLVNTLGPLAYLLLGRGEEEAVDK